MGTGVALDAQGRAMGARRAVQTLELRQDERLRNLRGDGRQAAGAGPLLDHRLDPTPQVTGRELLKQAARLQRPAQLVAVEAGLGGISLAFGGGAESNDVGGLELVPVGPADRASGRPLSPSRVTADAADRARLLSGCLGDHRLFRCLEHGPGLGDPAHGPLEGHQLIQRLVDITARNHAVAALRGPAQHRGSRQAPGPRRHPPQAPLGFGGPHHRRVGPHVERWHVGTADHQDVAGRRANHLLGGAARGPSRAPSESRSCPAPATRRDAPGNAGGCDQTPCRREG